MPSKRMVPTQELSDAGEDLVRLAAAKDAEIAALMTACENLLNALSAAVSEEAKVIQERDKATERRDRAMTVVEAARGLYPAYEVYVSNGVTNAVFNRHIWPVVKSIREALAALDLRPPDTE